MRTLVTALICCADAGASIAATASIKKMKTIGRTFFMLNTSFVMLFSRIWIPAFAGMTAEHRTPICVELCRASESHGLETYQYFVQLLSVKKYAAFTALAIAREFAIGL